MCGIVGAIVLGEGDGRFQVRAPYIDRMRDTMVHRGPDGAGTWVAPDGRLGLGHRRLSIIDLSTAAAQPMPNEDGALQITFNGEIYNHAEIRRELVARGGHDFCFVVPDDDALAVQETHETLYHILWELVHVFFEHEGLLR